MDPDRDARLMMPICHEFGVPFINERLTRAGRHRRPTVHGRGQRRPRVGLSRILGYEAIVGDVDTFER